MTDAGEGQFFEQFIDDYFAECEEHLAAARRMLLVLEEGGAEAENPQTMNDLARALHTLKGLSGMVGLASAEHVAHAMEDASRALSLAVEPARQRLIESLFDGARLLEACVASRRKREDPPPTGAYVDEIARAIGALPSAAGAPTEVARADATAVSVHQYQPETVHFEFAPSAEMASRGVGVEMIRKRLVTLGEIMQVTPRVRPGGGVLFDFAVAIPYGVRPPDEWRDDGLSWDWSGDAAATASTALMPVARQAPTGSTSSATTVSTNVVRVDLARLDHVMRMIGELVVTRSRLDRAVSNLDVSDQRRSDGELDDMREVNDVLERQIRSLREGVMRIRLVPIGEVFERMRFAMRDIARDTAKSIRLEFHGQDTEIDKVVVDRMLEPLMHLVRNAASHGIESLAERVRNGKPAGGTVSLRARADGDRIILEVEDDGAGIDIDQVVRQAQELGIATSTGDVDGDALLDLICAPGFSTRATADMTSGRGVGMAVVRTNIRALGGELLVETRLGSGTRFTIELPLTLMIADALLMEVGDQSMAIPQLALREILQLDPAAITRLENNEVMSYRGAVLPLINLQRVFNHAPATDPRRHVLVVGTDTQLTGLIVDRIIGLQEIVVHSVADPLVAMPGIAGATELADGRVSLILDTAALVRRSRERVPPALLRPHHPPVAAIAHGPARGL